MPVFSFVAIDQSGQERTGHLDAPDSKSAATSLKQQSLYVVKLNGASRSSSASASSSEEPQSLLQKSIDFSPSQLFGFLRPVRTRDRIFFLQQTALMLRSGLTLIQAIETCRHQTTKPALAASLQNVALAVRSGKSFSQAVSLEKNLLPPLAVRLLEAAEASGELDTVLDQLADHMEQRLQIRMTIITGLVYPAIVVLASVGVAAFLVVKIIPTFARFFQTRNTTLPASTQILIDISDFVLANGLWITFSFLALGIFIAILYRTSQGRFYIDRTILSIPVVGKFLIAGAMTQFSRTLSMLLNAGVTLLESLRVVRHVVGNHAISTRISEAADSVLAGHDFSRSLETPVIPKLVSRVVAVGERTGALTHVLDELGKFYDRELQQRIKRMTAMIEPVLILIIGGMVGFVYYSFFQAVFQIATAGR